MEMKAAEFCPHCGAGLGEHRREGEGTCPHCDPLVAVKELQAALREIYSCVNKDGVVEKGPILRIIRDALSATL